MPFIFLIGLLSAVAGNSDDSPPASLTQVISQRMEFKSAQYLYEFETEIPGLLKVPRYRYEARFSGDIVYWCDYGDRDGILARHGMTGRPRLGGRFACSPLEVIKNLKTREQWCRNHGSDTLRVSAPEPIENLIGRSPQRLMDPRSAGIFPRTYSERSPAQWIEVFQSWGDQWSEERVGDFIEVTASSKNKAGPNQAFREFVWKLDPSKANAIVAIKGYAVEGRQRRLIEDTTIENVLVDGKWWPRRCETRFLRSGGKEIFEFTKIEFNRKEHPTVLDADFLDVVPGVLVHDSRDSSRRGPRPADRYLGGNMVVSHAEWEETYKHSVDLDALQAYQERMRTIGPGQYPAWWSAGGDTFGIENVRHDPDQWEAYVRRWIVRHSHDTRAASPTLSEAQIESAWSILKDCRKRADPIIIRLRRELPDSGKTAQATGDQTRGPDETAAKPDAKPIVQTTSDGTSNRSDHAAARKQYESELGTIFDALRKRLDGLLTTGQTEGSATRKSAR